MVTSTYVGTPAFKDYLSLAKPRVIPFHLITAAAAMFLATRGLPAGGAFLLILVGGALVTASANALNCHLDRDVDGLMPRTRLRPLPAGRLKPSQAITFSGITGLLGLLILAEFGGLISAALAAAAVAYYILVYTVWLKRRTFWSTVIGSGAGAVPPLVGWAAATHRIDIVPLVLCGIVLLWTPAHFWSLAMFRRGDYDRAGLPVLPAAGASGWVIGCSALLVPASLLLAAVAHLGPLYVSVALLAGLVFLSLAIGLRSQGTPNAARRVYLCSILYVGVVFGAMVGDRLALIYLG